MAKSNVIVQLGYEDEIINEKYKDQVNFTTNKLGGQPDLPSHIHLESPICPLCQLPRPMVVQIYAPLENSTYHRTLYLFACINPNCWNHTESWLCLRGQTLEQVHPTNEPSTTDTSKSSASIASWCQDADDWDDDDDCVANLNEANGNVINNIEKGSDEDDESLSLEESVRMNLGNLTVDDKNANNGAILDIQGGGAVGRLHSPAATAEIEGDEGEVISIDTPTIPQRDIHSLLQEALPLPQTLCQSMQSSLQNASLLQFASRFVSVWEESNSNVSVSDNHVRELLQEYYQKNEDTSQPAADPKHPEDAGGGDTEIVLEKYEKSNPAHGDKMFHHFLSKIQANPGHILRYCRDNSAALLLYPLQEIPRKCQHCQGEMVFEFQILPTLIPKLRLVSDGHHEGARLEFGTVFVFTCRRSCWSTDSNVLREAIVLQSENY